MLQLALLPNTVARYANESQKPSDFQWGYSPTDRISGYEPEDRGSIPFSPAMMTYPMLA